MDGQVSKIPSNRWRVQMRRVMFACPSGYQGLARRRHYLLAASTTPGHLDYSTRSISFPPGEQANASKVRIADW